jgi:hypothetical protein
MRFHLLLLALFATTVLANGASIVAAMTKISKSTVALNTTVVQFPPGILGLTHAIKLLTASNNLLSDINAGTKIATASAALTFDETLALVTATQSLASTVQSTLITLIKNKKKFDKDLIISPIILLNLKQEKSATTKFQNAVVAKVPAALQSTAKTLTAPIDKAFDWAIGNYTIHH